MKHFAPLAVSLRGSAQCQETLHYGSIAVVDGDGNTLHRIGAPQERFPLRSTIKSIQLLPLLLDGLDSKLGQDLSLGRANAFNELDGRVWLNLLLCCVMCLHGYRG